jgi:hypothetical protein
VWPLASWVGFLLLGVSYPYRWFSGEGLLPSVLLAGVSAAWLARRLNRLTPAARSGRFAPWLAAVLLVAVISPTLSRTAGDWRWRWADSAPWRLAGWSKPGAAESPLELPAAQLLEPLAEAVRHHTKPGQILWSNAPYAGGLIAGLAGRPVSFRMLSEVSATEETDPIGAAHLILWFKLDHPTPMGDRSRLDGYALSPVAEDDAAILLRQAGVTELAQSPQAAMPLGVALGCLGAALALIAWELRRARQPLHLSV